MKPIHRIAAATFLATLPVSPALAGWKVIPGGKEAPVLAGTLKVTPGEDWNRWSRHPMRKGEVWTLDGVTLNELYFVVGLAPGKTLYKNRRKKVAPLPKLRAGMDLTEIPEFFESSNRIALNTSVFEVTEVRPAQFAGQPGVRFSFQYAVDGSTLVRKGEATAALVKDRLYLISFIAPAIHYFDRDLPKAEAIMSSAQL